MNAAEVDLADIFQQGLDAWAAQSRAVGDYTSFFNAQFTIALTKGTDVYDSLTKLAQGTAQDLRTAFSTFFTDFAVPFGYSFWSAIYFATEGISPYALPFDERGDVGFRPHTLGLSRAGCQKKDADTRQARALGALHLQL